MHDQPHAPGPSNIPHVIISLFMISCVQYCVIVVQVYVSIHGLLKLHAQFLFTGGQEGWYRHAG